MSSRDAAPSNPMTSAHGLRRLFHRHRWIREYANDAGIHETCGRCSKSRVRHYFLAVKP